ncbi:UNVERIFIED_CONTAM: hypothetical protein FKN15_044640, partial [Acipenser sinensis]
LILDNEGSYQCSVTGLMFEVSDKVKITYATLSWSKYGTYLKEPWKFIGPIFDVKCDPNILKAIHFPHSLCLGDHESDMKFGVLHIKDNAPVIESSSDHSTSHIKWNVTSLSPVGPIVQTSQHTEHHGVVLVYKVLDSHPSASFRAYLATNNNSDIKVFGKEWKQLGISYLNISKNDIDQIQEEDKEDLAMQKFNMLLEWKKKAKDNATIKDLYYSLHDPDVPYVVKKLLQGPFTKENTNALGGVTGSPYLDKGIYCRQGLVQVFR